MDLPDIVSLGKPSRFDLPSRQPWPLRQAFGRYELLERIPSGGEEECYWARMRGPAGFERIVFLRRFPEARLDPATIDAFEQQGMIAVRGVAQLFELGREVGWGYIVTEIVVGASVAALTQSGVRRRVSWLVALAIAFDACARRARVYERHGDLALAITPSRIMLSTTGEVMLCTGMPTRARVPWHRTLCEMIYPILALAADAEERELLRELFADDDPEAVWVASDALVQRHPELDPVLPIVFLSLAGRMSRAEARAALVERVTIEQLRALWNLVVDVAARRC